MKIRGKQKGYYKTLVFVDDKVLGHKASCKVVNHSPTGFQWGYGGSGPAQLALAILLLRTDDDTAQRLHQQFKSEFIATLEKDEDFEIEINVEDWIFQKGYKVMKRDLGIGEFDDEEDESCSFPNKCQRAEWKQCDCSCGGKNHGIQVRMFSS